MWGLILLAHLAAAPAGEAELHTLAGETLVGRLAELGRERVVLEIDGQPREFRTDEVLQIAFAAPASKAGVSVRKADDRVWLSLVDGSTLVGSQYEAASGRARLTLDDGGLVELPTDSILLARFRQLDETSAEQWTDILEGSHASDLLVVRKEDAIDFLEGVIKDVTAETIEFELDEEVLPVKRTKLDGLVYYHAAKAELGEAVCRVTTVDCAKLNARSVALAGEKLNITTRGGLPLELPAESIARLDFSQGKLLYLSDLDWDPRRSKWEPYFGVASADSALAQYYAPRRDRGFEGDRLLLGDASFTKGLALRSRTELVYRLPDAFRRLTALVGIDDSVGDSGDAHVTIRGDNRVLFDAAVTGRDAPQRLDLDIQGVRELTILVDYGRDGDAADYVDFCDAKVIK